MVVREDVPAEGIFLKDPEPHPPEIQNLTTPPSAPGDTIEAGVFNTSNRAEDIALVIKLGLKFYDYIEPVPESFSLVDFTAADTLFEGHTWGWDGIDFRDVVA